VSCVICGQNLWRLITQGEDYEYATQPGPFKIVECSKCKHVYLHPLPTLDEIPSFYPSTYYTVNQKSPNYIRGFILEIQTKMGVKRTLRFMEGFSINSIVDIGCGNASRLIQLADILGSHVELIGVDLHHELSTINVARKKGIILVEGNVESDLSALKDEGHDFIIMNQMIEHFRNPVVALAAIHQKLSPGGRLLIETPNLGGFDFYLFHQKYWGHWHIPRHLHLFTQRSLAQIVAQTGFKVLQQGYLPSPGPWILSLRNLLGLNSIKRSHGSIKSLAEFICFRNILVVSFFTFLDLMTIRLGLPTSTQYLVASK
jgi:2-polyprenyl-3-methyl-5-hydroxy-6-metoxy-1,4-benzoquinol methylase